MRLSKLDAFKYELRRTNKGINFKHFSVVFVSFVKIFELLHFASSTAFLSGLDFLQLFGDEFVENARPGVRDVIVAIIVTITDF